MTAPLVVTCIDPPAWRRPPSIRIPNQGTVEMAWDSLSSIPDPADLMSKFMNVVNLALASIRKYLQMVEVVVAIKQCIEAVPKAIMTLSPSPIFDCLKTLAKVFTQVMQDFPPFPYIFMAVDVAGICVDLIDAFILLFQRLDAKIAALVNLNNYALGLSDIELVNMSSCAMKDVKLSVQQILDVLKIVKPVNDILLSVILRLMPIPSAQKAANDYALAAITFGTASSELEAGGGALSVITGLPPLGTMFQALAGARNAIAVIYNVLAPMTGVDDQKTTIAIPTFQFL